MTASAALFPAPAGMIPVAGRGAATRTAFPRTRGDDPEDLRTVQAQMDFSPHPRG